MSWTPCQFSGLGTVAGTCVLHGGRARPAAGINSPSCRAPPGSQMAGLASFLRSRHTCQPTARPEWTARTGLAADFLAAGLPKRRAQPMSPCRPRPSRRRHCEAGRKASGRLRPAGRRSGTEAQVLPLRGGGGVRRSRIAMTLAVFVMTSASAILDRFATAQRPANSPDLLHSITGSRMQVNFQTEKGCTS